MPHHHHNEAVAVAGSFGGDAFFEREAPAELRKDTDQCKNPHHTVKEVQGAGHEDVANERLVVLVDESVFSEFALLARVVDLGR